MTERTLADRAGAVRELPAVPPLPQLPALAANDRPGPRAAALRIRGERIAGLEPAGGVAVLAGSAVLRFRPVPRASRYRIEVEDAGGRIVFQREALAGELSLPAGVMPAGASFHWSVRSVDRPGPEARGDADFVTLAAPAVTAREALRQALAVEPGAGPPLLLAAVDRELGLLTAAREELQAALSAYPGDPDLTTALAALSHDLEEGRDATDR